MSNLVSDIMNMLMFQGVIYVNVFNFCLAELVFKWHITILPIFLL